MSATELAIVIEGWAPLVGLSLVAAGALFAALQLRREAKARRMQAMVDLFSSFFPQEVARAAGVVRDLPDDFDLDDLNDPQRQAFTATVFAYNRIGDLLMKGLVDADDLFAFPAFSLTPVFAWDKAKRAARQLAVRRQNSAFGIAGFEFLAWQAQRHILTNGLGPVELVPMFDPNVPAMMGAIERAEAARPTAS